MFGSTILDVAIGLIFVFFLLSVITSHIDEMISQIFGWRSKDLESGIRTLLADPDLANKVWTHALIRGLAVRVGRNPSFIPSNTFALALFDAIAPAGQTPTGLVSLRTQAALLPENSARNALVAIIDRANGDMSRARYDVEMWFNSAMDRVTEVYKERILWVTILVALLVTLIFGVDSLALANNLWSEPALRSALNGSVATLQSTDFPGNNSLQDALGAFKDVTFPLGWNVFPADLAGWIRKLIGLLLTAFAISLGAPFWFDILKKTTVQHSRNPAPTAPPGNTG